MTLLMAAAALALSTPGGEPHALLRVALDGPEMIVAVRDAGQDGRMLTIDCVKACRTSIPYRERIGDTPMGLFQPFDAEPVIMSVWSSGSAYRVRAYLLGPARTTRILNTSTLTAPEFLVTPTGAIVVRTSERRNERSDRNDTRKVEWTLIAGNFVRSR